jgi:hypothetical protein
MTGMDGHQIIPTLRNLFGTPTSFRNKHTLTMTRIDPRFIQVPRSHTLSPKGWVNMFSVFHNGKGYCIRVSHGFVETDNGNCNYITFVVLDELDPEMGEPVRRNIYMRVVPTTVGDMEETFHSPEYA